MPLRVGIQLPEVEREVRWPEYLAMARAAEEVGFDSIWLGDHLLFPSDGRPERGPWEAWTLLAALAAVTKQVTLGPLVACTGFHPPGLLAKMAATLDEVSGGRFVLGLGAGWNKREFRAFGIPDDRPVTRFAESFAIIHGLLRGQRVSQQGEFCQAEDAVLLPVPRRRVPLMIGSNGPRMLAITMPHVDAWNTWYDWFGNSAEGFAELNARITAAAMEAGRPPEDITRSACALIIVDPEAGERPVTPEAPGIEPEHLRKHLDALALAGADEVILVVSPITEHSIRLLAQAAELTGG
ncbi:MAG: LLM class flavin-dependent oxidoreductase [Actinomycetota bacterium]|nr:LLM class flavin-dependent oxidoreductase [Actinomycetota bacterium]